MAVLFWGVLAAGLALSYFALRYVAALPDAPMCPACRGVTGQPLRTTPLDRLLARLGGTQRECPCCGWQGRMRWRLAPQAADHA